MTPFGDKWGGVAGDVLEKKVFEDVLPVKILSIPSRKTWANFRVALSHPLSHLLCTAVQTRRWDKDYSDSVVRMQRVVTKKISAN